MWNTRHSFRRFSHTLNPESLTYDCSLRDSSEVTTSLKKEIYDLDSKFHTVVTPPSHSYVTTIWGLGLYCCLQHAAVMWPNFFPAVFLPKNLRFRFLAKAGRPLVSHRFVLATAMLAYQLPQKKSWNQIGRMTDLFYDRCNLWLYGAGSMTVTQGSFMLPLLSLTHKRPSLERISAKLLALIFIKRWAEGCFLWKKQHGGGEMRGVWRLMNYSVSPDFTLFSPWYFYNLSVNKNILHYL